MDDQLPKTSRLPRFLLARPRWAFLAAMALLVVILIGFGDGESRASNGQAMASLRRENDPNSSQAYQFTGQGRILGGTVQTWTVEGVPITVRAETQIEGSLHPGDNVSLLGHITKDGSWIADRIASITDERTYFRFVGPLESVGKDAWRVAGIRLAVDENSNLGEGILLDELVLAVFQVQPDHTWLALEIQALSALEQSRMPTATPTVTPTPTPAPKIAPAKEQGGKPIKSHNGAKGKGKGHGGGHGNGKGKGHH